MMLKSSVWLLSAIASVMVPACSSIPDGAQVATCHITGSEAARMECPAGVRRVHGLQAAADAMLADLDPPPVPEVVGQVPVAFVYDPGEAAWRIDRARYEAVAEASRSDLSANIADGPPYPWQQPPSACAVERVGAEPVQKTPPQWPPYQVSDVVCDVIMDVTPDGTSTNIRAQCWHLEPEIETGAAETVRGPATRFIRAANRAVERWRYPPVCEEGYAVWRRNIREFLIYRRTEAG